MGSNSVKDNLGHHKFKSAKLFRRIAYFEASEPFLRMKSQRGRRIIAQAKNCLKNKAGPI